MNLEFDIATAHCRSDVFAAGTMCNRIQIILSVTFQRSTNARAHLASTAARVWMKSMATRVTV